MAAKKRAAYDTKLENILRGAARAFARHGYHRASIRDVSREAGVSLSGLYYYVASKEELLFLIQDHAFGTVLHDVEREVTRAPDPATALRRLIEIHLRYFLDNMEEMKVLSHEAGSLTGRYRRMVDEKKRRYTRICQDILRDLRPEPGIDLRVATFALFGMINWIYNWYRPGGDVGVDELVEDIYQLFSHGFAAGGAPEAGDGAGGPERAVPQAAAGAPEAIS